MLQAGRGGACRHTGSLCLDASRRVSNYSASTSMPSSSRAVARGYIKKLDGSSSSAPTSPMMFQAQRPKPSTSTKLPPEPSSAQKPSPAAAAPAEAGLERPKHVPADRSVRREPLFAGVDEAMDTYDKMAVQATGRDVPEPLQSFNQLIGRCSKQLLRNMVQMKLQKPTPVQRHAIPLMLEGRDLMACSATGSGKTAAFMVPVMAKVLELPRANTKNRAFPRVVVLAPTRELAQQIFEEAWRLGARTHVRPCVVHGGETMVQQVLALRGGCDLLVATPGRLLDHVKKRRSVSLSCMELLVLDEADRMLDMGFEPDLRELLAGPQLLPAHQRQAAMFSATLGPEVQRLASGFLRDYIYVAVGEPGGSTDLIRQRLRFLGGEEKKASLLEEVRANEQGLTVVFVATKARAREVGQLLEDAGMPTSVMHGEQMQVQRDEALQCFKFGITRVLVATGVAARGMDIPEVTLVVCYDMPNDISDYVHQIGRTGRGGRMGQALGYFSAHNAPLAPALVRLLEQSAQKVPDWLRDISRKPLLARGLDDVPRTQQPRFEHIGFVSDHMVFDTYLSTQHWSSSSSSSSSSSGSGGSSGGGGSSEMGELGQQQGQQQQQQQQQAPDFRLTDSAFADREWVQEWRSILGLEPSLQGDEAAGAGKRAGAAAPAAAAAAAVAASSGTGAGADVGAAGAAAGPSWEELDELVFADAVKDWRQPEAPAADDTQVAASKPARGTAAPRRRASRLPATAAAGAAAGAGAQQMTPGQRRGRPRKVQPSAAAPAAMLPASGASSSAALMGRRAPRKQRSRKPLFDPSADAGTVAAAPSEAQGQEKQAGSAAGGGHSSSLPEDLLDQQDAAGRQPVVE